MVKNNEPVFKEAGIAVFNLEFIAKRDPVLAVEIVSVFERAKTLKNTRTLSKKDKSIEYLLPLVENFQTA